MAISSHAALFSSSAILKAAPPFPPLLHLRTLAERLCLSPTCASLSSVRRSSPSPPAAAATAQGSAAFDLRGYWSALISEIDAELDAAVPLRYPARIYEAMRYAVLSPGAKRAPPVMCLAVACELLGVPRAVALPTACALEMIHAASLVHDDLPCMDAAQLRRGRPSNHVAFGVDMAVLAGDALFPQAFSHIVSRTTPGAVPEERVLRVVEEIARAVGSTGMAAGQYLDLDSASTAEGDVMTVLEKKFGEMAECSAACGGLLGGAGVTELVPLRGYGRAVGVLYQVVDDILMTDPNGGAGEGKMRSKASVVRVYGMGRAMEIVEEMRERAKRELQALQVKYGVERLLPLHSFVDYAVERGFELTGGEAGDIKQATATTGGGGGSAASASWCP